MRAFWLLLGLSICCGTPAWATPNPVSAGFAPIGPSGIVASLVPFISVPLESATAPTARINYVVPVRDGSGRLFINDVNGVLYQTGRGGGVASAYLDIGTQNVGAIVGDGPNGPGFAGVAFHPDFGTAGAAGYGKFYTTTNIANPGGATLGNGGGSNVIEIREWSATDPAAATFQGTSRVVTRISGYSDSHSNASLAFNPTAAPGTVDYGKLYIASGDGHYNDAEQNAQSLGVPQGKLLRIDPLPGPNGAAYTVPADNPYVGQVGKLGEVWASGLRFPQSFGWDTANGTMYINDLGQAAIEEVNIGIKGADYGWSQRAGTFATGYAYGLGTEDENLYPLPPNAASAGFTDPIAQYSHAEGNALGSGYLYRGTAIPALYGKYVMADIVNGRLFVFDPASVLPGQQATLTELMLSQGGQVINLDATYGYDSWLTSPRVDARLSLTESGELLLALKSNGQVFQLTAEVPEPAAFALLVAGLGLATAGRAWRGRSSARRRP